MLLLKCYTRSRVGPLEFECQAVAVMSRLASCHNCIFRQCSRFVRACASTSWSFIARSCSLQAWPIAKSWRSWSAVTGIQSRRIPRTKCTTSCCSAGGRLPRSDPHLNICSIRWTRITSLLSASTLILAKLFNCVSCSSNIQLFEFNSG